MFSATTVKQRCNYMNAPYTLVRATPVPPQETTQGTVLGKILFTL
jgi:hypothetical protein